MCWPLSRRLLVLHLASRLSLSALGRTCRFVQSAVEVKELELSSDRNSDPYRDIHPFTIKTYFKISDRVSRHVIVEADVARGVVQYHPGCLEDGYLAL